MIDSHHFRIIKNLPVEFPECFTASLGSMSHFLSLAYTNLYEHIQTHDAQWWQEKLRIQVLLRHLNPTTMVFDNPESPTAKFIRRHITDIGPRVDGTRGTLWLYDPSTTASTKAEAAVLDLFFGFRNRL